MLARSDSVVEIQTEITCPVRLSISSEKAVRNSPA